MLQIKRILKCVVYNFRFRRGSKMLARTPQMQERENDKKELKDRLLLILYSNRYIVGSCTPRGHSWPFWNVIGVGGIMLNDPTSCQSRVCWMNPGSAQSILSMLGALVRHISISAASKRTCIWLQFSGAARDL